MFCQIVLIHNELSLDIVSKWIRQIRAAISCVLQGLKHDIYIKRLITRTCKDNLFDEYEAFMNAAANRAAVSHQEVLQHILEAFLGPDESEALKEEIKKI